MDNKDLQVKKSRKIFTFFFWFLFGLLLIGIAVFAASKMRASDCALGGSYGGTRPWCENGWLDLLLFGVPLGAFVLLMDLIAILAFIFRKK
jgi:hypothetical protein